MNVPERIAKLREQMKENGIDIYIVPTADFHQSEYVGEHFKARSFITGFTGSAGTAVITMSEAGLWTDGRYFIQATEQLKDTTVTLQKMGEEGVLTIEAYLEANLPTNGTLGFDGRVISMGEGQAYEAIAAAKSGTIKYEGDLVNKVWEDRPVLSEEPAFALDVKYAGETVASKLERLRAAMKDASTDVHIITSLDDVCWLLNIRGNDIEFFPLVLCYAIVALDHVDVFVDERKLNDKMQAELQKDGIVLHPYNEVYEAVKRFDANNTVLVDPTRMNYALYNNIKKEVLKVEKQNPNVIFKAMKNEVEIANIKKAQIKDGIAHARFMYWLKSNVGKETITEMSASDKLDELRAQQDGFIRPSFAPISAFGEHAAIVHYESEPETNIELTEGSLYLSDTGAGFYEGSTDITRTFAFGEVPQIMKDHFTATVQSNLHLTHARFLHGCTGMNLDILTRAPFWNQNLNYNHGTGHGVGYLMNIHEAGAGFRWQYRVNEAHPLEAGMIITNEPGIYIQGSHGVRIENELLVCKGEANEYGQFMYMEAITYVPIDLDAINPDIMSVEEKRWLNDYHKDVYEKIAPHLEKEEQEWFKGYTRAI